MAIVEKRGKAKTRTIRIDTEIDDEITVEAEKQNKSVNNIIEDILLSYLNHKRYVDEFNALTILPDTLRVFLKYFDEDSLAKIGEEVGRVVPRQGFIRRGIVFDDKAVLDHLLTVLGGSDNWFEVSYHEGNTPYLYIRNSFGSKWLVFVEAHIKAFYKRVGHEVEVVRVGDNLQILL